MHNILEDNSKSKGLFNTRVEAEKWLESRIVRFDVVLAFRHQYNKVESLDTLGHILDKTAEGFKEQVGDKPLSKFAKVARGNGMFMVVKK